MRIFKDSILYLIGELFSKSIPFLLLPYLTRRLGIDGFGEMSYYQTILAIFTIIIGLSQEGAVSRYFYFYGKRSINLIVTTGYVYTICMAFLMLCFCWVVNSSILAILVVTSTFQSLFSTQLSVRQCQKLAKQYITLQFISAVLSGGGTWCLLTITTQQLVEKRFIALLISNLLCVILAYYLYSRQHNVKFCFSVKKYKCAFFYFFGFGFPLILHQVSGFLKGQLDRLLIYHQFSAADLGIYSAAFQIASILSILLLAINKACVPYFYEGLKKGQLNAKKVVSLVIYSLPLIPIPALIAFFLPEKWMVWFLGSEYLGVKYYIFLFLFGIAITIPYFILVNYFFYYGKTKIITFSSILSCIVYCFLLYLMSQIEISYIPYALIISNIFMVLLLLIIMFLVKEETNGRD
ncbi:flippase [Pectobacterium parmentieri]|uniref:Polysaccharide biosynthesis protein CpsL n=1 Tax=Pectobacterium parmentieri TaxID=1905730 RepID=A0A0H3I6B9_PECPM|nr:oligosaccharide flippase family protein [Pectobacterium parmentieri]ACX88771.1 polysaccharide biosynthesis protein [Pectobacterium parmentieri WPP163]AFI91097.1 Polysaccharide biosynthesis protein CpsL [Pectobacterium parmentieri]MCL6355541.1 flippase [Pectobacterium parmentieri]MCL6380566.1 flippase [Pectobacterium parmentieri]RKO80753.1 flippase [Pectobacterium parmentieri]